MNRIALTDQDVIDATVVLEMLAPTLDAALESGFYITTPFPVILAKFRGTGFSRPTQIQLTDLELGALFEAFNLVSWMTNGARGVRPIHEKLSAAISQRGSTFFGRRALNIAATRAGAAEWFGLDVVKQRLTASPETKPALDEIEPKPETIRVLWEDKETGVRAEWHAAAPHWRLIDPDGSVFGDNYNGEQQVKDAAHGRNLYIKWYRAGAVGRPPIGSVLKIQTVRVLWENKETGVRAEWHAAAPHWRVIDSDGSLFQQCNSEGEAKWQAYGRSLVRNNGLLLWHDVETAACARYQQAAPHWWAGIGNNWTSCDNAENAIAAAQRMAQERRDEKRAASQNQ
jgi:hypothetical protein